MPGQPDLRDGLEPRKDGDLKPLVNSIAFTMSAAGLPESAVLEGEFAVGGSFGSGEIIDCGERLGNEGAIIDCGERL